MKITYLLSFIFMAILFVNCESNPCSSKAKFEMSFNDLVDDFKTQKSSLSDDEIKVYKEKFNVIFNDCYKTFKEEMSLAEKQNFWKKSIVFYSIGDLEISENSLSFDGDIKIDPEIKEELEAVLKESGEKFVETIKNLTKEELPKILDKAVGEIEKLAEEIKEALKDKE